MIKIKLKRIVSMLLIVISTCTFVYAEGNTISVQEAINIALKNSADILKYSNTVKDLEQNYTNAILSSRQLEDFLEMDEQFERLSRKSERTPEEEAEYRMLRLILKKNMSLEQKLELEKQSVLSPMSAEYLLTVNRGLLKSIKDNIYFSTYKSFNDITKTENAITLKQSLISSLENNYRSATMKYSQGKVSYNDLKLIGLDLQKAKIELNKLRTEKQKYMVQINKITGVPLETIYSKYLIEKVPENISIKALGEYTASALANRDDFKSAKQNFVMKENEYKITIQYYPSETNINCRNASVAMEEAKIQLDSTEIEIELQVMGSYNSLQNQLTNLEKSKLNREISENILRETESRYKLGLTTEYELSKANRNYTESQLTYLSTARDAWLAKLNLDITCGITIE